jgi:hypothetical protein
MLYSHNLKKLFLGLLLLCGSVCAAQSPTLWYKFDEGTGSTANDSSGNGYTGTWTGTKSCSGQYYFSPGKIGPYAGCFNGSDAQVAANANHSYSGTSGVTTISCWIYVVTAPVTNYVGIVNIAPSTYADAFKLGFGPYSSIGTSTHSTMGISTGNGTSPYGVAVFTNSIQIGVWMYLAAVYDGTGITAYLNGVVTDYKIVSGPAGGTSDPLVIGNDTDGASRFFDGYIDDVRIYNSVLTASQIYGIYAAGAPIGSGGNTPYGYAK